MTYTEDTMVQEVTAEYLEQELGWESVYAFDAETFGPSGTLGRMTKREMVLRPHLRAALERLNPGLSAEVYDKAVAEMVGYAAGRPLLAVNQEKHDLMRDGIPVMVPLAGGQQERRRLRVFDFDDVTQNRFVAVRELWMKGETYERRADLVCFVNGLPVVFIEAKKTSSDLKAAYVGNITDYKDTVPHAFYWNAFIILGNGDEAKMGSVTSHYSHYFDWKRLSEDDVGVVEMETLLRGVLNKQNLLDIIENFIVFDDSGKNTVKIVAQNHQFLGVNEAMKSVRDRVARQGKLGVFWHTQGSGKSYSMVFFSRKVHRKVPGSFSFLVLTDREDLDNQIYRTFTGCGLVSEKDAAHVGSAADLPPMLGQNKRYVFSLIQKFHQKVTQPYSLSADVIVMTDEAHRTQGGILAENLRDALPNASFIGFTGTPLMGGSDDKNTVQIFGEYVSTYDFQRAVQDRATVPLIYDSRGKTLQLQAEGLDEKLLEKIEEFGLDDEETEKRLKAALGKNYLIMTDQKRLEAVAQDFVAHYSERWESGKAMLVCVDKLTAGRMLELIQHYWAEEIGTVEKALKKASNEQDITDLTRKLDWMRETISALVISGEQNEKARFRDIGIDIEPHRKLIKDGFTGSDGKRVKLEDAFKDDHHPFRIAVVCAMWLTGFDVPSLATLYLDKPLKAHTLMQTIARANRVYEGKPNGLIVDYWGILESLNSALARFAAQQGKNTDQNARYNPLRPKEELLASVTEALDETVKHLMGLGVDLQAIIAGSGFARNKLVRDAEEAIKTNDETRRGFLLWAAELDKRWRASINYARDYSRRDEIEVIRLLAKHASRKPTPEDITRLLHELRAVVGEALSVNEESGEDGATFDISKIDFERLRQTLKDKPPSNSSVQDLKALIEKRLRTLLKRNPTRTSLQQRYEEIVAAYNKAKDRAAVEATFTALLELLSDMTEEDQRVAREGLDEASLTLFDLLLKPELTDAEREKVKPVATGLLHALRELLADRPHWKEREDSKASVHQQIFDYLYDDSRGLPTPEYTDEDVNLKTEEIYSFVLTRDYGWLQDAG